MQRVRSIALCAQPIQLSETLSLTLCIFEEFLLFDDFHIKIIPKSDEKSDILKFTQRKKSNLTTKYFISACNSSLKR